MNKIVILILFASQVVYGQFDIQHEPERLFNMLVGKSTTDFIKEHKLKKITFLRDTLLSSSIEFDQNGNSICKIGMENNAVRKTLRKYDKQNREIETKHFSPDSSFRYGYYYKYKDGIKIMYKLKDSLLFRKTAFIKPENIELYSEYNKDGSLRIKNIYTYDDDMKYLLETRFKNNRLDLQYQKEYFDNKKYVTRIVYDDNGTKTSEKRNLKWQEFPNENKLKHYSDKTESVIRVDSFDINKNIVKIERFDIDNKLRGLEISNYNSKGQLIKVIKENLQRDIKTEYIYNYDNQNRIEKIDKITNGIKEIFRYEYKTF